MMTDALFKTETQKVATMSRVNQKVRIASLNRIKNLKNHCLSCGTYLYSPYMYTVDLSSLFMMKQVSCVIRLIMFWSSVNTVKTVKVQTSSKNLSSFMSFP